MTYTEFYKVISDTCIKYADDYTFIGVRFEDKDRQVGDVCEQSKHNPGREDERDFPEFGTVEYDELPELPGTSAWLVYNDLSDFAEDVDASKIRALSKPSWAIDDELDICEHAYIVAGRRADTHSDADDGEIVIIDAVVINVLY